MDVVSEKNVRELPVVRCLGLHRLVKLVQDVQMATKAQLPVALRRAAEVVFDPATDAPYTASDPKRWVLTDLLGVELDAQGEVKQVFARVDFYWECWDVEQDVGPGGTIAWYDYRIDLPRVELGEMRRSVVVQEFVHDVTFSNAIFAGGVNFRAAVFGGKARFGGATFMGPAQFRGAKFMDKTWFSKARFINGISLRNATCEESFNIEDIVLLGSPRRPQLVDFSGTVAKTQLLFSVSETPAADEDVAIVGLDTSVAPYLDEDDVYRADIEFLWAGCGRNHFKPGYGRVVLGLLNSNLDYFSCDDRELKDVTLLWRGCPKKPTRESYGMAGGKIRLERYLHELRIKRRLLQNMHWVDLADECYSTIMDRQLLLRKLEARSLEPLARLRAKLRLGFEEVVFKGFFGWGVRLGRSVMTVVGVIGAFWAVSFALGFFNVYADQINPWSLGWVGKSLKFGLNGFLGLELPAAHGLFAFVGIAEAGLGFVLCTVFVAILARKFMRL